MNGNLVNELTFMSSFTITHKDGVGAMVYAPNVGGTQINFYLATCHKWSRIAGFSIFCLNFHKNFFFDSGAERGACF